MLIEVIHGIFSVCKATVRTVGVANGEPRLGLNGALLDILCVAGLLDQVADPAFDDVEGREIAVRVRLLSLRVFF